MSGSYEFLIILCISSPRKEAICMPAKHRMLVALTLRSLGSKSCEDSISARIKWGEIVESPFGTVGKANSSANGDRFSNLKTQFESSSRSQRERSIMGWGRPHLPHALLKSSSQDSGLSALGPFCNCALSLSLAVPWLTSPHPHVLGRSGLLPGKLT